MKTYFCYCIFTFSRSLINKEMYDYLYLVNKTEATQHKGIYVTIRHGKFRAHTSCHANDLLQWQCGLSSSHPALFILQPLWTQLSVRLKKNNTPHCFNGAITMLWEDWTEERSMDAGRGSEAACLHWGARTWELASIACEGRWVWTNLNSTIFQMNKVCEISTNILQACRGVVRAADWGGQTTWGRKSRGASSACKKSRPSSSFMLF